MSEPIPSRGPIQGEKRKTRERKKIASGQTAGSGNGQREQAEAQGFFTVREKNQMPVRDWSEVDGGASGSYIIGGKGPGPS